MHRVYRVRVDTQTHEYVLLYLTPKKWDPKNFHMYRSTITSRGKEIECVKYSHREQRNCQTKTKKKMTHDIINPVILLPFCKFRGNRSFLVGNDIFIKVYIKFICTWYFGSVQGIGIQWKISYFLSSSYITIFLPLFFFSLSIPLLYSLPLSPLSFWSKT